MLFERSLSHFKSVEGELKAEEDKYAEYVEMIGGEEEGSTSAAGRTHPLCRTRDLRDSSAP